MLQYAGIGEALKSLCEQFGRVAALKIDVVVPPETSGIPAEVGLCVFRVTQECLQNIAKHSGASCARVVLECNPTRVRLTVSDTGKGFVESEAAQKCGLGLISMKERIKHLNGQFDIDTRPSCGTRIRVTIPL
jgi:signal transduction histidine kinase